MVNFWKRVRKVIKSVTPKAPRRPSTANGEWTQHKGEDVGVTEVVTKSNPVGQKKGVDLSKETNK